MPFGPHNRQLSLFPIRPYGFHSKGENRSKARIAGMETTRCEKKTRDSRTSSSSPGFSTETGATARKRRDGRDTNGIDQQPEGDGIPRGGEKNTGDVRVRDRVLPWTASELKATARPIAVRDGQERGVPPVGLLSSTFRCSS
mmetsp:Transcript_36384/g.71593  ORF Transcript_36384/g.71593 Transcript_36384/m.71593 type:complete len:142 (+) Transcript_36384:1361-1786(+)